MDVEMASAACPNCKILLVETNSCSTADVTTGVDAAVALGATAVSMSFGMPEFSGETTFDSHFAHPGVAFFAAAGDSGYGQTLWPAASPGVFAVGGTDLYQDSSGAYYETAWSGSGSGCSLYEPKPSYQTDSGCSTRTIADMSAVGGTGLAVYSTYPASGWQVGWQQGGGTSASTPLAAAMWTLMSTTQGMTNGKASWYGLQAASGPWGINDITSGSTGSCGTYLCQAGAGYDGPTGLGSPRGPNTSSGPAGTTSACPPLGLPFAPVAPVAPGTAGVTPLLSVSTSPLPVSLLRAEGLATARASARRAVARSHRPVLEVAFLRSQRRAQQATLITEQRRARLLLRARFAWLASHAARGQRLKSREEFAGLSSAASQRLWVNTFTASVSATTQNPASSLAGHVIGYLDDYHAVLRTGDGRRLLAVSSVPLRGTHNGRKQPLNLSLQPTAGGFAPTAPSVPVQISDHSAAGVAVGSDGVRVTPVGTDVPGRLLASNAVFYAGVGTDMDAVAAPTPTGVELFSLLRSRQSPEAILYRVQLPAGAALEQGKGGADVVRGGAIIARVLAPSAKDAQGQPVPATMQVSGTTLIVRVPHRQLDVAYPIEVDPLTTATLNPAGWSFPPDTANDPFAGSLNPLTITANPGNYFYQGVWRWDGSFPGYTTDHVTFNGVQTAYPADWNGTNPPGFGWRVAANFGSCAVSQTGGPTQTGTITLSAPSTASCPPAPTQHVEVAMTTNWRGNGWQPQTITEPWSTTVASIVVYLAPAPSPAETWGPGNPAEPNVPHTCKGKPVDCATGNQWEQQHDLHVPGLGLGLDLTRTYNSQAAAMATGAGMFGYGWSSTYSAHLVIASAPQTVTVVHDDGSQVSFDQQIGGAYTPATPAVQSTLVKNPDGSYTYTLPDRRTLSFDSSGRLTAELDRNGNADTLAYDAQGRLTQITDPAGRALTLSYNSDGTVDHATDPSGYVVRYGYDGGGNLVQVTDVAGGQWRFGYDGSHQMTSMTDPRNGTTTSQYDGSHRVISQNDALNRKRTWSYPNPGETVITNPAGDVTDEQFAGLLPVQIMHAYGTPLASTQTIAYDTRGNPTTVTDANGYATSYTYDAAGNRTSATDPSGDTTTWTYDSHRDITSITTPLGDETSTTYDASGSPTAVSRTLTETGQVQTTSYGYDSKGELTTVTDPLLHTWTYAYDGNGNRTSATSPLGHKTTYGYDQDSRLVTITSANGNEPGASAANFTTTITRDAFGRPTDIRDPLGHHTVYAYDANGNRTDVTDRDGRHTHITYDAENQPTSITRPDGSTQQTGYDADGQVISQTNGAHRTTTYRRNQLEQITQITDPLNRTRTLGYDAAGNLISLKDPAGRTTTYGHDPENRLISVRYSTGNPGAAYFFYDADGNRTYMLDQSGLSAWSYDSLDRLSSATTGFGAGCTQPWRSGRPKQTTTYTWDLANHLTKIGYPTAVVATVQANGNTVWAQDSIAGTVTRAYDADGRLTAITDWNSNTTHYGYDAENNITAVQRPDSSTATSTYDANSALTKINDTSPTGFSFIASYTRTPSELVSTADETASPGGLTQTYTYDNAGRLQTVQPAAAGVTLPTPTGYGYDTTDNLTTISGATGTTTQTYDAADQLNGATNTTTGTSQTYTYDSNGNRAAATSTAAQTTTHQTYTYDQANQLATYTSATQNALNQQTGNSTVTAQYLYDGTGLRVGRFVNQVPTMQSYDESGTLPLLLVDGTTSYIYGPDGLPLEQILPGGTTQYYHHDQLGSTRALTDPNGHPVATYNYDAYGQALTNNAEAGNPMLYGGQYTDPETGLQYLRARYYDPQTGQFLTRDPIEAQTRQPYSY
ncbi:MAG: DUF6531 domain-containing protein, partial [Terriglobales bacterium]